MRYKICQVIFLVQQWLALSCYLCQALHKYVVHAVCYTLLRIRSGTLGCMTEPCESVIAPCCVNAFSLSAQMKSSLPFQLLGSLVSPTAVFSYNLWFKSSIAFFQFFYYVKVYLTWKLIVHVFCVLCCLICLPLLIQLVWHILRIISPEHLIHISYQDLKWFVFQKSTRNYDHQKKYK